MAIRSIEQVASTLKSVRTRRVGILLAKAAKRLIAFELIEGHAEAQFRHEHPEVSSRLYCNDFPILLEPFNKLFQHHDGRPEPHQLASINEYAV
jgi:hypothetical protein